jgi:hypothetical protein
MHVMMINFILVLIKLLTINKILFAQNTSLPYNKYAYLTTHNSFAIKKRSIPDATPLVTFTNQEDTISQQLHVRYHFDSFINFNFKL